MRRRKNQITCDASVEKVVNRPMPEEETTVQEPAKPETTYRRSGRYSESYRHLYGLRQDVLEKSRQLEWSLDRIVLYVRDLLRQGPCEPSPIVTPLAAPSVIHFDTKRPA